MVKRVVNAKLIAILPLKPEDVKSDCFSWLKIFHGSDGHVYYAYLHEDWIYCPLKNINIDYCEFQKCEDCKETEFFVIVNNERVPVKRLT